MTVLHNRNNVLFLSVYILTMQQCKKRHERLLKKINSLYFWCPKSPKHNKKHFPVSSTHMLVVV